MKKLWKKPSLEILDVSMTMKHHGDHGGGSGEDEDEIGLGS